MIDGFERNALQQKAAGCVADASLVLALLSRETGLGDTQAALKAKKLMDDAKTLFEQILAANA